MLKEFKTPFGPISTSWDEVSARIYSQEEAKVRPIWPKVVAMAASIALLAGAFFLFQNQDTVVSTGLAQQKTISLPDGSKVLMNASSTLSYDADDFLENRELKLEGEAFFEVEKGSSFIVLSPQGAVQVLGTSFNVLDREGVFEIACKTGRVAVESGSDKHILTPGLCIKSDGGALSKPMADDTNDSWTRGEFYFQDDRLQFVLEELERQFAVEIDHPDVSGLVYSGEFDTRDLNTALQVVCSPMGMQYDLDSELNVSITFK